MLLVERSGEVLDESLNNELFNALEQHKPMDELFMHMADFFELQNSKKAESRILDHSSL